MEQSNQQVPAEGLPLQDAVRAWFTTAEQAAAIERWLAFDQALRTAYVRWRLEGAAYPGQINRPLWDGVPPAPPHFVVSVEIHAVFEQCVSAHHARASAITAALAAGEVVMRHGQFPAGQQPSAVPPIAWKTDLVVVTGWFIGELPPVSDDDRSLEHRGAMSRWRNSVHELKWSEPGAGYGHTGEPPPFIVALRRQGPVLPGQPLRISHKVLHQIAVTKWIVAESLKDKAVWEKADCPGGKAGQEYQRSKEQWFTDVCAKFPGVSRDLIDTKALPAAKKSGGWLRDGNRAPAKSD